MLSYRSLQQKMDGPRFLVYPARVHLCLPNPKIKPSVVRKGSRMDDACYVSKATVAERLERLESAGGSCWIPTHNWHRHAACHGQMLVFLRHLTSLIEP